MCEKAKEFPSSSFSDSYLLIKENKSDISSEELEKQNIIEEEGEGNEEEEEKEEDEKEDEKEEEKENDIYNKNNGNILQINPEEFNNLEQANNIMNLNDNINQGNDDIQNVENINEIGKQNINANKEVNLVTQNTIGMQPTGASTTQKITSLNTQNNFGKIKIKPKIKQFKDLKEFEKRNYYKTFVKDFFRDLINFINVLIEKFNKKNNTNINCLKWKNGNIYCHANVYNELYLLDRKAIKALTSRAQLYKEKDGSIKAYTTPLPNKEICYNIYKEEDEKMKIHEVIAVFDTKIKDLMDIYLKKVFPQEDFYKSFQKYEEYLNNTENQIEEEKKELLIEIGNSYKSKLKEKIDNPDNKRGPKPRIPYYEEIVK